MNQLDPGAFTLFMSILGVHPNPGLLWLCVQRGVEAMSEGLRGMASWLSFEVGGLGLC